MRKEFCQPHDISTEIGQEKSRRSNSKALLHAKSYITLLIFLRNPSTERVDRRA